MAECFLKRSIPKSFNVQIVVDGILCTTVSIRIVADCVALSCQVTRKLERVITPEFTAISAIIFIHCCAQSKYSLETLIIQVASFYLFLQSKIHLMITDFCFFYHTTHK
jgi:hypothetical protein